jgi:hypothetical protein
MPRIVGYRYHVVVEVKIENAVGRDEVHQQIEDALHEASVTCRACWDAEPISVKALSQYREEN